MILTEKDAWKKSCRHRSLSGRCEASVCMAWRWIVPERSIVAVEPGEDFPSADPDWNLIDKRFIDGVHTLTYQRIETPRGYCGLAGKPDLI